MYAEKEARSKDRSLVSLDSSYRGMGGADKTCAHKKGRCKRSGQSKTFIKELQINVYERSAINRKNLQLIRKR
ncbi:hypothetical protein [Pseudomonas sp. LB3P31]